MIVSLKILHGNVTKYTALRLNLGAGSWLVHWKFDMEMSHETLSRDWRLMMVSLKIWQRNVTEDTAERLYVVMTNDCMKESRAWNMWKSLSKCHDCTDNSLLFVYFISYLEIVWVVHEPEECGNIYESAMISQTTIFLSILHFSSNNCKTFLRSCNMWKSLWICHDLN